MQTRLESRWQFLEHIAAQELGARLFAPVESTSRRLSHHWIDWTIKERAAGDTAPRIIKEYRRAHSAFERAKSGPSPTPLHWHRRWLMSRVG